MKKLKQPRKPVDRAIGPAGKLAGGNKTAGSAVPTGEAESAVAKKAKKNPVKILLVEDHQDTRLSIQRLLEFTGHQVSAVASAAQALEIASSRQFDLVLSDLGLPDQTGYELMTQLRRRHGLQGIALSGYDADDDTERSLQAGFRGHLVKPISFEQLKEMITLFPHSKQ